MLDPPGRKSTNRTAGELVDLRVLADIPDAVTVQDARGGIVFANEAAARALGIDGQTASDPSAITGRFEVYDEAGEPIPPERFPGRQALKGSPTTGVVLRVHDTESGEDRWATATAW